MPPRLMKSGLNRCWNTTNMLYNVIVVQHKCCVRSTLHFFLTKEYQEVTYGYLEGCTSIDQRQNGSL